jgi:hypothetical protein
MKEDNDLIIIFPHTLVISNIFLYIFTKPVFII